MSTGLSTLPTFYYHFQRLLTLLGGLSASSIKLPEWMAHENVLGIFGFKT